MSGSRRQMHGAGHLDQEGSGHVLKRKEKGLTLVTLELFHQ